MEENLESQAEIADLGEDEGRSDLLSSPNLETTEMAPQTEAGNVALAQQTNLELLWPENPSDFYYPAALEEEMVGAQARGPSAPPPPLRRTMPKRIRVALLIFCIVGVLAFTVDGILLAISIMRHHHQPSIAVMPHTTILPQDASTAKPVQQVSAAASTATSVMPTSVSSPHDGALSLSSSSLIFSTSQGQTILTPQTVILSTGGQSAFSWQVVPASSLPSWLTLTPAQGTASLGTSAQIVVNVQVNQLAVGTYHTRLYMQAFNSQSQPLPGSPQTLDITLNVLVPCSLSVTPEKLSFESVLLSSPASQSLSLKEGGSCIFPVTWLASSDSSWVKLSRLSVSDSGSGSTIVVSANISGKLVGSYTAQITLQATDARGLSVAGSPLTIPVTLTVVLS